MGLEVSGSTETIRRHEINAMLQIEKEDTIIDLEYQLREAAHEYEQSLQDKERTIESLRQSFSEKTDEIHRLNAELSKSESISDEYELQVNNLQTILRQKECLIKALVHYLDYLEERND